MSNEGKALKSGFWYLGSNFIIKSMALVTTPIFTRLLTKNEFGDFSNFFSWTTIAVIIISMKMESSLISAKYDYEGRIEQYNLSILSLTFLSAATWGIAVNIFPEFFSELLNVRVFYINLMLLYCFFYSSVTLFQMSDRFQYKYKRSTFVAVLVAVSSAFLSVVLVLMMQDKLTGRVLGMIVPPIIIGSIIVGFFIRNGKKIDYSVWPYTLRICIPYVPHLLSLTLLNSMDKIMITNICGSSDTALYSVAYTCGNIVTLLMVSLNSAFAPWLGDMLHDCNYSKIRDVSKKYIILFCCLAIFMMLFAPELLLLLGGTSYMSAKYVMAPVAMGCVCQFLYTLFVNVEQFNKKTTGMAFASIAAAVLNYVLNILLIPTFGYVAAAYTTLAGYLFLLITHMLLVIHIGYRKTYSYIFVLSVVIVMLFIMAGINVIYKYTLIRFIITGSYIVIILVILIIKRSAVSNLVRVMLK